MLLCTGLDFAAFGDLEDGRSATLAFKETNPVSSLTVKAVKGASSLGVLLNGESQHPQ